MADVIRILGQLDATTTSDTLLYTVPILKEGALSRNAETSTTCSTLCICNRTGGAVSVDVAVLPEEDGTTVANKHYIYNGKSVAANDSIFLTIGITLGQSDKVYVKAGTANALSFSLFGVETF